MNLSIMELLNDGKHWVAADHAALLLVALVLPLLVLLARFNTLSVIALGFLAAGLGLVHADVLSMPMAAFLLLGSSAVLLAIDGTLVRRRIGRMEERLAAFGSALRVLEIAEERRQSLLSRGHSPVSLMAHGDRGPVSAGNGTEEANRGFSNWSLRSAVADAEGVRE